MHLRETNFICSENDAHGRAVSLGWPNVEDIQLEAAG